MKLLKQSQITISPLPTRRKGESQSRAAAKALRAWRRGERPDLTVTAVTSKGARHVAPDQIEWSSLERTGGAPGRRLTKGRVVRLSILGDATLDVVVDLMTAASGRKPSGAEAVRVALHEYAERRAPKVAK